MAASLTDRVREAMGRGALVPPGASVLALVSGGADSMCMLDLLCNLHDGRIGVLTFDHGLREQAADECAMVERFAAERGLDVWRRALRVEPGAGLQDRARQARRTAADAVLREAGFDLIATGHTADDQVETILFRLARGTGRTGAIGMRARSGMTVRPLLTVSRDETRAWCDEREIPYVDDPSNDDPAYARVRVRSDLVPAFARIHPGAFAAIGRFAAQLADEDELLQPIVDEAWKRCAADAGLDVGRIAAEPPVLARLVVRRFLAAHGVDADERWVAAAVDLALAGRGRRDMPGADLEVFGGILRVRRPVRPEPPSAPIVVPGRVEFGTHAIVATSGAAVPPTPTRISVPAGSSLHVRGVRPGGRIPLARAGSVRVGRLLRDGGVPASIRNQVPIVIGGGRVVWVAGYRANPHALAEPGDDAIRLELV